MINEFSGHFSKVPGLTHVTFHVIDTEINHWSKTDIKGIIRKSMGESEKVLQLTGDRSRI